MQSIRVQVPPGNPIQGRVSRIGGPLSNQFPERLLRRREPQIQ